RIKAAEISNRFHHELLGHIPWIRKPTLDRGGNSFQPCNSCLSILISFRQHGQSSGMSRNVILRFGATSKTGDPSSSEICLPGSPQTRAEGRAPGQSASRCCDRE